MADAVSIERTPDGGWLVTCPVMSMATMNEKVARTKFAEWVETLGQVMDQKKVKGKR
ncbi:hypothetical protein K1T35_48555 (plasmid) [Pseudonocardia sp. DSM 110487]|uniref:hypothetical protein n=1 Tax=Pseudonocardia sp. DSM 110487 TaxID=2865833 RepID=UPI001C6A884C|nr:hypothetical protein [Pseudonocardia sp. DSM 110487]QYN41200.1 hypothetical protein K1T35_48555 [Pseudonocardia sp. DSM 110487]